MTLMQRLIDQVPSADAGSQASVSSSNTSTAYEAHIMTAHCSVEEYQRFLGDLYETLEQQLREAKRPAKVQQKALCQCCHIKLKHVEGTSLTVCLPSDERSLRVEIHDGEVVLILEKGAPG
ncbi:hypothetical protein DPV78_003425 [Talaromyces pinophilus]|nr:hypothetical protein DPV78_003425 [Talaromyces pinophilus]